MKTTLMLLTIATLALGASLKCPVLAAPGAHITATPNSTFGVCWEDLPVLASDLDYNDQILSGTVDSTGTHATILWTGSDAALNDILKYQGSTLLSNTTHPSPVTISTTASAEIVLNLSAGANLWATGTPQAIVWQTSGVPEPTTLSLAGIGLLGLVWVAKRTAK